MKRILRHLQWKIGGRKVFTLVGRSGTGKSFRSKLLAEKYGIELIIDDGLLIRGDTIIEGHSAKKQDSFLSAIRTAIFDDPDERYAMIQAIAKQRFKRILVLGTSEKMVSRIIARLYLPRPCKCFQIEDVATQEEIAMAIRARTIEGKHVIPVAHAEISKKHSNIIYDTIKVFMKKSLPWQQKGFEKTEVQPQFNVPEPSKEKELQTKAIQAMIEESVAHFDPIFEVKKVILKPLKPGYSALVRIRITEDVSFGKSTGTLKNSIIRDLAERDVVFENLLVEVFDKNNRQL